MKILFLALYSASHTRVFTEGASTNPVSTCAWTECTCLPVTSRDPSQEACPGLRGQLELGVSETRSFLSSQLSQVPTY